MKNRCLKICLVVIATCSLAAAQSTDRKAVLQKARQAYYSLRGAGLDEFQSTVKPNWELVLKDQLKADPAGAQAGLKLLNGLHFSMVMDKQGKVTVDHRTDAEPPNEQVRAGFDQIYRGIDQAVSGFFATWSLFMLTSPFPEINSDYQLEDLGKQYRLSYKEGSTNVTTMMTKDLTITEIKVISSEFTSTIRPQLVRSAKGLILAGYNADYQPTSGPGVVKLDIKIEHQAFSGMQLPALLVADTVTDGAPNHMELAFSQYQVKSH